MPPPAADVPRCAQRLTHGDLVILEAIQSSTAYAVRPADQQAGEPALLYLSCVPPHGAVEAAACLEVVEQGEWLGLRSPMLEGLYLQARKKTPHLVFFSPRLGVWEQWKAEAVYQGLLQQQNPAICLTSRQVPAITLSVRAWRVGCAPIPQHIRHLPGLPLQQLDTGGDHEKDQQQMRPDEIPDPESEPGLLEHAPSATSSLQDDALELSHYVVKGYVMRVLKWPLYIAFRLWRGAARSTRRQRQEEALYNAQREQSAEWAAMHLRAAADRHARHMIVLACQCWTRHTTRRLVAALQEWHARASRSSMLERICELCRRRERRRRAAAVLTALSTYLQSRRSRRLRCDAAIMQLEARRVRRILWGWRACAIAIRPDLCTLQRRRRRHLQRAVLVAWHLISHRLTIARRTADIYFAAAGAATLRAVVGAWRGLCAVRCQLSARAALLPAADARRRLSTAWCTWRAATEDMAWRHHRVDVMVLIRHQQLAGRVLRRWVAVTKASKVLAAAAEHMAARRMWRLLPVAFAAWRAVVAEAAALYGLQGEQGDPAVTAVATERLMAVLRRWLGGSQRRALARRVLAAWRSMAATGLQLKYTAAAFVRVKRRALAATVLLRWQAAAQACAEERVRCVAVHQAAQLRKALRTWAWLAARNRRLRSTAALAGRRIRFRRLCCAFAAWRAAMERGRERWCRAVGSHSSGLALRALTCWRRRCGAVRAASAAMGRCRQSYERQLLRAALTAMAARVALRAAVLRCERRCWVALARRSLQAWQRAAACRVRLRCFGRVLQVRWQRCVARGVLRSWFAASHESALQVHLLEAMRAAAWGEGQRCQPCCFPHRLGMLPPSPPQQLQPQAAGAVAAAVASRHVAHAHVKSFKDYHQESALRLLLTAVGCASAAGGRGGATASAAMVELLSARLPALARLASAPRRHAHAAFKAWRLVAARRARLQAAAARLADRCKQLLLAVSFHAWAAAGAASRGRRAGAMAMARRLVRALATTCLCAWQQHARWSARLRLTCEMLLARRTCRQKRQLMVAWRGEVRELRERLQDRQRSKQDARLALLERALKAWQAAREAAAEAQVAAERRHAAVWTRVKWQVLSAWRHLTVLSLQHLATCARLLQTRAERRLLASVLGAWSAFAQQERQRREDWPMLCRVFYAWQTLVQPAGRAAVAAAAAAAELEAERRLQSAPNATPASTSAAGAACSGPPGPPSGAASAGPRIETAEAGRSPTADSDVSVSPATEQLASLRCSLDVDEHGGGQAGALAAQNMAWQHWYRLLQAGGLPMLPGGPMLLPLPPAADSADAAALRARLERLEDAVRRGERGEGAREEGVPTGTGQQQPPPPHASANESLPHQPPPPPPPLAIPPSPAQPSVSTRATAASCRPEPGPQVQVRQPNGTTTALASGSNAVLGSGPSQSFAASAPAPAPATDAPVAAAGASGQSAATGAAGLAAVQLPAVPQQLSPSVSPASSRLTSPRVSASVLPEPGPLYQIRQGGSTHVGRASDRSLGLTDPVGAVDHHRGADNAGNAAPGAAAPPQPAASSAPQQQQPQQPGLAQAQVAQQQQQQPPEGVPGSLAPVRSSGSCISSSSIAAEPGPLFQMKHGNVITVGRAGCGFLTSIVRSTSSLGSEAAVSDPDPIPASAVSGSPALASAAGEKPSSDAPPEVAVASAAGGKGGPAAEVAAPARPVAPAPSVALPPQPTLPPPGLARSSSRLVAASVLPEPGRASPLLHSAPSRSSAGSSSSSSHHLHRYSSGVISAVDPLEAAAVATAAGPSGTRCAAAADSSGAPQQQQTAGATAAADSLQAPPWSAFRGGSPRDSISGSARHSVVSSSADDSGTLGSPGSLQAWSRRTTAEALAGPQQEPQNGEPPPPLQWHAAAATAAVAAAAAAPAPAPAPAAGWGSGHGLPQAALQAPGVPAGPGSGGAPGGSDQGVPQPLSSHAVMWAGQPLSSTHLTWTRGEAPPADGLGAQSVPFLTPIPSPSARPATQPGGSGEAALPQTAPAAAQPQQQMVLLPAVPPSHHEQQHHHQQHQQQQHHQQPKYSLVNASRTDRWVQRHWVTPTHGSSDAGAVDLIEGSPSLQPTPTRTKDRVSEVQLLTPALTAEAPPGFFPRSATSVHPAAVATPGGVTSGDQAAAGAAPGSSMSSMSSSSLMQHPHPGGGGGGGDPAAAARGIPATRGAASAGSAGSVLTTPQDSVPYRVSPVTLQTLSQALPPQPRVQMQVPQAWTTEGAGHGVSGSAAWVPAAEGAWRLSGPPLLETQQPSQPQHPSQPQLTISMTPGSVVPLPAISGTQHHQLSIDGRILLATPSQPHQPQAQVLADAAVQTALAATAHPHLHDAPQHPGPQQPHHPHATPPPQLQAQPPQQSLPQPLSSLPPGPSAAPAPRAFTVRDAVTAGAFSLSGATAGSASLNSSSSGEDDGVTHPRPAAAAPAPAIPVPAPVVATAALHPLGSSELADVEALLGELEARSRSAMSAARHPVDQLGEEGTVAAAGAAAAATAAQWLLAASAGGALGRSAALGLQGLDGIDALLVRATTLSAPGAPIFTPRGGLAVDAGAGAESTDGSESLQGRIDRSALEGNRGGATVVADPVNASLRRLEAASAHARAAAAAWCAATGGEDDAALAAPQQHPPPGGGATGRDGARARAVAAAAAASGLSRPAGLGQGQGGSAANLLSTFLPGAQELVLRQAGPSAAADSTHKRPPQPRPTQSDRPAVPQPQPSHEWRPAHPPRPSGLHSSDADGEQDSASDDDSLRHIQVARQALRAAVLRSQQAPPPPLPVVPQAPTRSAAPSAGYVRPSGSLSLARGWLSSTATSDTEADAEVEGTCPRCGSPTRTQRRPSPPPLHSAPSAPPQPPPQQQQPQQRSQLSEPPRAAVPRELVPSTLMSGPQPRQQHHDGTARTTLEVQPGKHHSAGRPVGNPPRPSADPLEEVALLAQRRGNYHLAATLADLAGSSGGGGGLGPSSSLLESMAAEAELLARMERAISQRAGEQENHPPRRLHHYPSEAASRVHQPPSAGVPRGGTYYDSSSDSAANGGGRRVNGPMGNPEPRVSCSGGSHSAASGTFEGSSVAYAQSQGQQQQQQRQQQQPSRVRQAELPTTGTSRRNCGAPAQAPERARLPPQASPRQSPRGDALPSVPSTGSQTSNSSSTDSDSHAWGTSSSSSGGSGSSSGGTSVGVSGERRGARGGGGRDGSGLCEAVANGFDPDPLHSPLRGVLGECQRLQSCAARREAEGDAVVRDVVAELSPRSAVAAALQAVRQQNGRAVAVAAQQQQQQSSLRDGTPLGRRA